MDNMEYKAAIFDFDGTIVNSMPHWEKAIREWGKKYNIDINGDLIRTMMYKKPNEAIDYIDKHYKGINGKKAFRTMCVRAVKFYITDVKPISNAAAYLKYLRKNNIKTALLTNCPPFLCKMALLRNGMYNLFDEAIFSNSYSVGKDKPDLFLITAEKLGVNPGDCMVYEDSYVALSGARAAKMGFTAVLASENVYSKELIKEADRVIERY